MENTFDFKSRIATSREESEKLLSLGLKKETADCGHFYGRDEYEEGYYWDTIILDGGWQPYWDVTDNDIPAWSLYRLIEIAFPKGVGIVAVNGMFNNIINLIEKRINNGTFPKEYLND